MAIKKSTQAVKKKTAVKKSKATPKKAVAKKSKLAVIKTQQNEASVEDFINSVPIEQKRKDSFMLLKLMQTASKEKPKMWGSSIIGFGNKRYKSPNTEREVDWFKIGFSPRKANLTVYMLNLKHHAEALKKLGKHKTGGGCLYINKLDEIDLDVLKKMISDTLKAID